MAELFLNFHDNFSRTNPRELFIFGEDGQTVTVQNGNNFNEQVSLNSDGFAIVDIPAQQAMTGTGVNNLGFQITSQDTVQAYFSNRSNATTDLTIVFDKDSLGTEYVLSSIGSSFGSNFGEGGQFSVQATEDNTVVDVTFPDGQTFSQTINTGETFKFATGGNNGGLGISIPFGFDLTGTIVETSAPAAVFSGHSCTQIGGFACDHIVEQMPPKKSLSTSYVVGQAFKDGVGKNLVRVVAADDNTQVTVDGSVEATLSAGESYDFTLLGNAAEILTSEPALVAQYLQSDEVAEEGDPAMMFVPGQDAWLEEYKLATPADSAAFEDNLVNVVIPTTALNSLELDKSNVDTSGFTQVGNSSFSVGNLEIEPGLFTIEADEPFQVSLFGYDFFDSYLTFGAASFASGISNVPPVAVDDGATTNRDTVVTIDVLDNDLDVDGDSLSIDTFDANSAQGGEVTLDDNGTPADSSDDQLTYTPPSGFTGTDSFNYTISDGNGGTDTATVSVTVNAGDDPNINGTPARDVLTGTDSDEIITGGFGGDTITGGSGEDTFVYQSLRDQGDIITDFTIGEDIIDLRDLVSSLNITPAHIGFENTNQGTALTLDADSSGVFRPYILVQGDGVDATTLDDSDNFLFSN